MHNINEIENNPFIMEVNAPYSLNYLVFIQNVFENGNNKNRENPLFPYVDSSRWGILQNEFFTKTFKEVWNEVVSENVDNRMYDHSRIFEFESPLYQRLFE